MQRHNSLATTSNLQDSIPPTSPPRKNWLREEPQGGQLPKQQYGRTKEKLSIIGFGGMVVKDVTPKEAANFVAEAVDRGVNYFDVAPFYGNAQRRLGPALKPYRPNCFLACKTLERDAAGAARELKESLKLLKTDHFDLYQLHALYDVEEVEQAFGPGGAMETILKAKEDGKIRYIGFSAHSGGSGPCRFGSLRLRLDLIPPEFSVVDRGQLRPLRLPAGEERLVWPSSA